MRDFAEAQHDFKSWQAGQTGGEIGAAIIYLGPHRLVLWRHAAHRIGYHAIFQPQPVIYVLVVSAFGKAEFIQRRIQQIAGPIAGERSAGTVGTGHARREADNQQFRVGVAKARHGRVKPIRLGGAGFIAIGGEARADLAVLIGQGGKLIHARHDTRFAVLVKQPAHARHSLAISRKGGYAKRMIYLALGSNMRGAFADSRQLVEAAITNLPLAGAQLVRRAPLYGSLAVGPKVEGQAQHDYINTVVAVRSVTPAIGLLRRLHALEAAFGRQRRVQWGPRTLDIDIISYHGAAHMHGAQIPHPRLAERAFVLRPLADIAPGWRHPISGAPIAALLAKLPPQARHGLKKLG